MRWVSLHPTNIAQKVQIVEHYRANVRHLLDGHAKAMVVTASREHAVRYKHAIDAYIAKRGYPDIATLVAFSGSIEIDGVVFPGVVPPYTETNLNPGLRGRKLDVAFATDEFQIMLVANKFQTGFDQPLLSAMYVDKRLSGVMAVQTLSRLNRTYPAAGKDTTYALDFVDDPGEILDSFRPYYRDARLEDTTDPDLVHDLQAKLDGAGIYTDAEVDAFAEAYLADKHGAMTAPLTSAAKRFNERYQTAIADEDKAAMDQLDMFRKDVSSFVRLARRLDDRAVADAVDFSTVELTHIKQARSGHQNLNLAGGEAEPMKPVTATGSGTARDPRMVRLQEVLDKVNDLFADEDFTPAEQQSWVEGIVTVLMDNETIITQAAANSKKQFVESPDLSDAVTDAVWGNRASHDKMADQFFTDDHIKLEIVKLLGSLMHENVHAEAH